MIKIITRSPKETADVGEILGREIIKSRPRLKRAFVVALYGNLGAGKTVFVKGFAKGVGARGRVASPTFVIMRRFPLRKNRAGFRNLFHIDAYRIKNRRELGAIDFHKIIANPRNIAIIEWPSNIHKNLKKPFISGTIRHGKNLTERGIDISKVV